MASTREFKTRLKSISSIKKITKAMKMVAASKLRIAQKACENARPFNQSLSTLLSSAGSINQVQKHLIVPITSDRGLCGGVNTTVIKTCKKMVKDLTDKGVEVSIIAVGEKGKDALLRECGKHMNKIVQDLSKKPVNFLTASVLAEEILNAQFDQCTIIYNEFKSVIVQRIAQNEVYSYDILNSEAYNWSNYEFESDQSKMLYNFYEFNLATKLLASTLENVTSEQGARMSAMDSASKNASEMIDKLSLIYNKARQAAITSELIDIISAAGAV
jgi:F-type H+-transporting ATPase subunit gamma